MQEQEKPTTETVHLPTGGSIPGIPGQHGPGHYIINWIERTLTPVADAVATIAEHVEEKIEHKTALEPEQSDAVAPIKPPSELTTSEATN